MAPHELLPRSFYERDTLEVARDLLGRWLVAGDVVLRISEVEAYRGPTDSACHTASGRTARNEAMWGPVGHAYVYRCYGLHWMLNVVSGDPGSGCAVLVRGAELVLGGEIVATRRGRSGRGTLAGPAKVAQALAVDRSFDRHDLTSPAGLSVAVGTPAERVLVGPRVGINYALPEHRDAPWRLAIDGSAEVSVRRTLRSGYAQPMSSFEGERPRPSATAVFLQVALGVCLTFALHAVIGGPLWALASVFDPVTFLAGAWLMGLSIVQLLYVGPVALALAFVRRPIALGMLIGAAITFLLQSACYGVAAFMLQGLH